jgi:diguanylate cyclase (GGDEF)-like protein
MGMQNALYIEINAIGIVLLLVLLFAQRQDIGTSTAQRQFNMLVYATIAALVADTACWLIDGTSFAYARGMNIAIESVYYVFNGLVPYLWALYVEFAVSRERTVSYRRLRILAIPAALLTILLLVNLKTGFVFAVDLNNVYHRSAGFILYALGAFGYLIYAAARTLQAARHAGWNDEKRRYYAYGYFMVPAAIGGLIQTFIYGTSLIWVFTAVSILILYIFSLKWQISSDPLTGLNNRRELVKYLHYETREPRRSGVLTMIMLDVDGFKQINDTCGHYYGDGVLMTVAEILKQSCKDTPAFLARHGGDEFCIVYPAKSIKAVEGMIAAIQENVAQWNAAHNEQADIGLSIGYSVWNPKTDRKAADLYNRADQKMYEMKNGKKKP